MIKFLALFTNYKHFLGELIIRGLVPVWIGLGAGFKLYEHTPKTLPSSIKEVATAIGIQDTGMYYLLAFFIAIEISAIVGILLLTKFSRYIAIFILSIFCFVLLAELVNGNFESCGCLGAKSPPPWVMLLIDSMLLIGVFLFPINKNTEIKNAYPLAIIFSSVGFILTFSIISFYSTSSILNSELNSNNSTNLKLPTYFIFKKNDLIGKSFENITLLNYIDGIKEKISKGSQYLIFYSATCEHCQVLLEDWFSYGTPVNTSLIRIPEFQDGFDDQNIFDQPCIDCSQYELPVGTDWDIPTPLVFALEDGEIICIGESEDSSDPKCLIHH